VPELPVEFDNDTPLGQNDVTSDGTPTGNLDRFMSRRHRQSKSSQLGRKTDLLR
jgi:hypothetical protein